MTSEPQAQEYLSKSINKSVDAELDKWPAGHNASDDVSALWILPGKSGADGVLDDNLEFSGIGYPPNPLKLQELSLCDTAQHTHIEGWGLTCPNDITCVKCIDPEQRALIEQLTNRFTKSGRSALNSVFESEDERVKEMKIEGRLIIKVLQKADISSWQKDHCITRNRTAFANKTLVIPLDQESEKVSQDAGFFTMSSKWCRGLKMEEESVRWALQMIVAAEILQHGISVLWSPALWIWHGPIVRYLGRLVEHRDILGLPSPNSTIEGQMDPQFAYVASNQRTRIFFKTVAGALIVMNGSHERYW
eukprot:CAMPEP_0114509716 /NCGR_PEP_ID=MMETSP0109-20121206/13370_1 /TAXON_ID=29199 /ORGANISM="Chlorarachnion reptans, Strain CCCM449" /LENGTH=304 /DNA_ID=CAMNT_0001688911 /DNA_START=111 /DNA_END=1022 /DNA_ORIENTATION=-